MYTVTIPDDRCIYCSLEFDSAKGEGDHVLPRAFGKFDGALIFRGICPGCNNKLSRIEEELLRTAPEAALRRLAGATHNRRGEPVGWQTASGVPPPRFVIKHADHEELVEADPAAPGRAKYVDQFIFVLTDGRNVPIVYYPGMTASAVRRMLEKLGISEADMGQTHWKSSKESLPHIMAIVNELWPDSPKVELPTIEPGIYDTQVRAEFRFTQKYYQAIAKIAFHYYLTVSRLGYVGHEAKFAAIREFIVNGGDYEQFFRAPNQRHVPHLEVVGAIAKYTGRWMHVLCGYETALTATIAVFTVFGPRRRPSPLYVTLYHEPTTLTLPGDQFGHVYVHGHQSHENAKGCFVKTFL